MFTVLSSLAAYLVLFGLVFLLFRAHRRKRILAAAILLAAATLIENFCMSLLSCLALFWLHSGRHIAVPVLNNREIELLLGISLSITIFAAWGILRHLPSALSSMPDKWCLSLSLPLLAITGIVYAANWGASNGIMVRSGGNWGLYYDQLFSHLEFCVLTVLSMFAAGFYVWGMERIFLEQKKSEQYHSQLAAYQMLREQHVRAERVRHDLKNHLLALQGLLENREWAKMAAYLKSMEQAAAFGMREEITGNSALDMLLTQKREMALEKNILWECDVQIPKACCIEEFDLCVLFGNILDNAVEACERLHNAIEACKRPQAAKAHMPSRPRIRIQARAVKRCFLLEVQNSTDQPKKPREGFTRKPNPREHGIGLLNVRDVVQKYDGTMDIQVRDGLFVISVLVPFPDAGHDIKQDS